MRQQLVHRRAAIPAWVSILCICLLTFLPLFTSPSVVVRADGSVSGTVYRDYNANGQQDGTEPGFPNITITAYSSTNAAVGSTTSAADGTYTLAWAGTPDTRVRIEFTGVPTWASQAPFGTGAGSGTSVRFVDAGDTGVNYGVMNPSDYSQPIDDVELATSQHELGVGTLVPAVVKFDYIGPAGTTGIADAFEVGATWGMAYRRPIQTTTGTTAGVIYVAALAKRQVEYGPGGSGAIYAIQNDGIYAISQLTTIPNAGAAVHDSTNYAVDSNFYAAPGKQGLGGLDISGDQQTLYVTNLNDRQLYAVNIATGTPTALGVVGSPTCGSGGVYRPFAVAVHDGLVYVGGVCTSEGAGLGSAQGIQDLQAYVFTYNPIGGAVTQVLTFPLNYPRGCGASAAGFQVGGVNSICTTGQIGSRADWQPWQDIYPRPADPIASGGSATGLRFDGTFYDFAYAQPMLAGITFVGDDMVLSLRDRMGDQLGNADVGPNGTFPGEMHVFASGDILRASRSGSTWTLESNSSSVPPGSFGPSGGANNQQGPNGGEFYVGDNFVNTHSETSSGGIVQVPGQPDVVSTVMDPDAFYTQGVKWLNNGTGVSSRAFRITNSLPVTLFGKSNGLGDLVALVNNPPIEIGNYVWYDANNDGIHGPDETALEGVMLELVDAGGNVIATATTDVNGQYIFSSDAARVGQTTASFRYGVAGLAPNSTYSVRIPLAQTILLPYFVTLTAASDPARDSNGVLTVIGGLEYSLAVVVTAGAGQNDHTFDFGFSDLPPVVVPPTPVPGAPPAAGTSPLEGVTGLPRTGIAPVPPLERPLVDIMVALTALLSALGVYLIMRRRGQR